MPLVEAVGIRARIRGLLGIPSTPPPSQPPVLPDVHPNMRLLYERARVEEDHLRNEIDSLVTKATAAIAFFGVIVVGVFTGIAYITWGFAQIGTLAKFKYIFLPNVVALLLLVTFMILFLWRLFKVEKQWLVAYPWVAQIEYPESLLSITPQEAMIDLLYEAAASNSANRGAVLEYSERLSKALRSLVFIASILMVQAGYNATVKALLEESRPKQVTVSQWQSFNEGPRKDIERGVLWLGKSSKASWNSLIKSLPGPKREEPPGPDGLSSSPTAGESSSKAPPPRQDATPRRSESKQLGR